MKTLAHERLGVKVEKIRTVGRSSGVFPLSGIQMSAVSRPVRKSSRTAPAFKGLWILLVALFLTTFTLAQDDPRPSTTPTAIASPIEQSAPSLEESASTPSPQKNRSRTVGELLLGEGGGPLPPDGGEKKTKARSTQPSTTQGKFVLRDPKPVPEHWATEGRVGRSTFFDQLIRVCWSLAIVSLLVWIAGKVAEKVGFKEIAPGSGSKSMIEIIEKKRLSPGRTILLMRVGPKVLAVAATEKGYETLTEMDGEQFKNYQDTVFGAASAAETGSEPGPGGMTPGDVLRHYLSIIPGTGAKK